MIDIFFWKRLAEQWTTEGDGLFVVDDTAEIMKNAADIPDEDLYAFDIPDEELDEILNGLDIDF